MQQKEFERLHFILASKSPRRQFLLGELGIPFELKAKEVDESFPDHLVCDEIPLYLCRKKAAAFEGETNENTVIITADTIVWINGHVLNKPAGEDEARVMLTELSGNRHEVYTGVCLKSKRAEIAFSVRSDVYFKTLSPAQIGFYIKTFRPFDKAGAYGAQECLERDVNPCSEEEKTFLENLGKTAMIRETLSDAGERVGYIDKIEGSYFNVMGLPVVELYRELKRLQIAD
jgi:septum formation protein